MASRRQECTVPGTPRGGRTLVCHFGDTSRDLPATYRWGSGLHEESTPLGDRHHHPSLDPAARGGPVDTSGRRRLTIGIDGTCLASARGYGRFLRELLPPLLAEDAHDYQLFLDAQTASGIDLPDMPVMLLATGESQASAASASGSRSPLDLLRMGRGVARHKLDAFYFPSVFSYFPIPSRLPIAVAIHDTIPERHGRVVFPDRRTRLLWTIKSRLARWQAKTIITVSDYARQRIAQEIGIPESRIIVTPEGPSPVFHPSASDEPARDWLEARGIPRDGRFLLYVGGFNPHKNVIGLVRALARLKMPDDVHLILVGDHAGDTFHGNVTAIRREITLAGLGGRIHWAGFVADEPLRELYGAALALVLPSLEEGFGLPAVEAAACGTPCVATLESPLPQVLEGGGLFFAPDAEGDLEGCLETMWSNPLERKAFAETALKRAQALSWETTARATRAALEATAGLAT